ncbi:hypothetical protein HS1genome_1854 [Sulfodiicoccus acidiphilus]|uniref:Uncharacterized protein n=1 Tax=Sulfodiicoccus acidiphilus TaxID=1670455 RepID=A0A348B5L3_9CREN|nr:hypothetical protein HS1genome_1854 [Sulfodiicoccus acidiphilus]
MTGDSTGSSLAEAEVVATRNMGELTARSPRRSSVTHRQWFPEGRSYTLSRWNVKRVKRR